MRASRAAPEKAQNLQKYLMSQKYFNEQNWIKKIYYVLCEEIKYLKIFGYLRISESAILATILMSIKSGLAAAAAAEGEWEDCRREDEVAEEEAAAVPSSGSISSSAFSGSSSGCSLEDILCPPGD